ncbi:YwdI family protein [Fictibacillus sp. NRS-1165]|uniref:YwdI family protein n=1 Tax=Fictibacillus sp. NRS-1165 TaxID=3144463 RepID=UPI003D1E722D
MSISVRHIITLMEKHLTELKQLPEGSPKTKENAAAIKTLCDLMLESDTAREAGQWMEPSPISAPPGFTGPLTKPNKKMDDDEEGNGDSIFDF